MSEEVEVFVQGYEDEGEILVKTRGTFRKVAGNIHILYEEQMDDSGEKTRTHVVIREHLVEVHRHGQVKTDFLFEEGAVTKTVYETPYLAIPMEIHTKKLSIRTGEERIEIHIQYSLFSGQDHLRDAEVRMVFCGSLFL